MQLEHEDTQDMNSTDEPVEAGVDASAARGSAEQSPRWRVGRKVPINVYDENDAPVCQCQTVEYAKQIVEAVNYLRRVREVVIGISGPLKFEENQ